MFMKNKALRVILCTVLSLVCLYVGISCIATLHKAMTQPYLMAGTVRYDFTGYYLMATICGAVCLFAALVLIFLVVRMKKHQKDKGTDR